MQVKDVAKSLKDVSSTINNLKGQSDIILNIIKILQESKKNNKVVYVCGNGGSASTASHLVCDLFKHAKIRSMCLNDTIPLVSAITNDLGWENAYSTQLERMAESKDVLILFSVHGGLGMDQAGIQSKNLTKAIEYANSIGMITIGITGSDGGTFRECKVYLIVPSESTPIIESIHSAIAHIISFLIDSDKL
jgi:D-sedoheptulose 7-phosphate isomerase